MQPPPYPPYPHQPAPPNALPPAPRRAPLNGLAVAALVTGVLCMVPVVGVVLGAIALVQIRRTGERGKGMAVTGLVLSSVGTLLCALVLVGGGAGAFVKGFKEGAREGARDGGAFSLRRGECFDTPGGGLQAPAADMDTVPCAQRHAAEVVGTFRLPGPQAYPGDAALRDRVEERCQRLADGYAMDAWAVPADVKVYYYAPDRETWKLGDREVTCVFGKEKGTLKGSLRQDASTLDAHQVAYLEAANALNEAMAGGPEEEYVEDDLDGYRKWAGEVTVALAVEARALRAHDWPAGAAEPVAALAAEAGKARAYWARAAAAKDADAYYEHYEDADAHSGHAEAVRAREALGLATTVAAANPSV
ncbi:DUF4190 domain-containing protein [Actinacidiphila glaucinigra]|uniref:DUF4190 domain-containing protein n=2 Tax=Actinacidiphila glaucinigra TaxID=235986 RepID=UPI00366F47E7